MTVSDKMKPNKKKPKDKLRAGVNCSQCGVELFFLSSYKRHLKQNCKAASKLTSEEIETQINKLRCDHFGEETFPTKQACPKEGCRVAFNLLSSLTAHLQKVHGVDPAVEMGAPLPPKQKDTFPSEKECPMQGCGTFWPRRSHLLRHLKTIHSLDAGSAEDLLSFGSIR